MKRYWPVVLILSAGSLVASANSLPDYPPFELRGQIGGNPSKSVFTSDASGILTANANVYGSFHDISLRSKWNPDQLRLRFSCVYVNNDNNIVSAPTYKDGENCPPSGSATSRFIRAIRIELDGANRDDYNLRYSCLIGYFNQKHHTPVAEVSAGQYCGNVSGGAPQEWLSQIVVKLSRK